MASVQSQPGRASSQAQQKAKAAIAAPLPTGAPKKRSAWPIVLITFLLLLGATYGVGRFVEPVRIRFEKIPTIGPLLFTKPVPDLEGDGADVEAPAEPERDPVQQALQSLDRREAELTVQASDLTQREEALAAREAALEELELALEQREEAVDELRLELRGMIEDDKARAAILGNMKPAQVASMFSAMDDHEILRLLQHLEPDVNAKILAAIDPNRAARLMLKLGGGQLQLIY